MSILKKITRKALVTAMLAFSPLLYAQSTVNPEYQVKAVFLFHFTQFVEWPPTSFSSADAPFIIGIFGQDPFGSYLKQTVSGEKVKGHPVIIQYYKNINEIQACHMLFINKTEAARMGDVLSNLKGKNIFTVSDAPGFLDQGGMVKFFNKNNKIQLQVNLDVAKAAQLDISSKLLRLCEIYVSR